MEYSISKVEITRRKKAYVTLVASLLIGIILTSTILRFQIPIPGYFSLIFGLSLLGAYSFNFFRNLIQIKIILSDKKLKRITDKTTEEYLLSNIDNVTIKRKTNNTIREIYISFIGGENVVVSALGQFEKFSKELVRNLDKSIKVKEKNEPLDYDHPLFYKILGLMVGFLGVVIIKFASQLSYKQMIIGLIVFLIYLLALSVYLIKTKPISRRVGEK